MLRKNQDNTSQQINEIYEQGNLYEKGILYKQEESGDKYINKIMINYKSFFNYDIIKNPNFGNLRIINIIFKYLEYEPEFNNIYNKSSFKNEIKNNIDNFEIIETIEEEDIIWKQDIAFNFFKYINFYIDDIMIEELNEYIYKIHYYYYLNKTKQNSFDNIIKLRESKDYYYFNLPIIFWFTKNSGNFLPLVSLQYSKLLINLRTNKMINLIENNLNEKDLSLDNSNINITFNYTTFFLDDKERKLFSNYKHEYLIKCFKMYPSTNLLEIKNINQLYFKNMITNIFWITQDITTKNTYFIDKQINRDKLYNEFVNLYQDYINYKNGINIYQNDFDLLDDLLEEINNNNSLRITILQSSKISNLLEKYMLFILYFDSKFINHILEWELEAHKRLIHLYLYFYKIHKDDIYYKKSSIIEKMTIKSNGISFLSSRDYKYFNNVVALNYFNNTPPLGFLSYSFSLYPTEFQPSGHLNFNNLDDIVIKTELNEKVLNNPVKLNTIVSEYKIFKIISGIGAIL